jgi:hypothetical protein
MGNELSGELKKELFELRLQILSRIGTRLDYDVDQRWLREAAISKTDTEILRRLKRENYLSWVPKLMVIWRSRFSK